MPAPDRTYTALAGADALDQAESADPLRSPGQRWQTFSATMATNSWASASGTDGNSLSTPSDSLNWSYLSGCPSRTQIPWATTQPVWGSSGMPVCAIASTKVLGTSEVGAGSVAVGVGVVAGALVTVMVVGDTG